MDAENVDSNELDKIADLAEDIQARELSQAVADFNTSRHEASFSVRHPELGKMIKCDGCGRRHRSSIIHERKFATDIHGEPCEPRVAEPKRFRQVSNRYGWRVRLNPLILLMIDKAKRAGVIE